jgi:hypothetical protein
VGVVGQHYELGLRPQTELDGVRLLGEL